MNSESNSIKIYGAKVHNLKNVDLVIPRNKFVVFTGVSGSGKSSLAFDTIYAEGQRRYIETFSAYARQFIGNFEKPDVEKITGLSPVISIEQKTTNKNPRSTVGTITEIYDFLRLLYAKIGVAHSHISGKEMIKYTEQQIIDLIYNNFINKDIILLSPVVKGRKGHYKELFEKFRKRGYLRAQIDGEITELTYNLKLDRYKNHNIEIVIDRFNINDKNKKRLRDSLQLAMQYGNGITMIKDNDTNNTKFYSKHLMCHESGVSYNEPAPHHFSFNSPNGACPKCNGLGYIYKVDIDKIISNRNISIAKGAISPLGSYKNTLIFWQIEAIARKYKFSLNTPVKDIPDNALNIILYGSGELFKLQNTPLGNTSNYFLSFDGIVNIISNNQDSDKPRSKQKWSGQFMKKGICDKCNGKRLKLESLQFKINNKNIAELSSMDLNQLFKWFNGIEKHLSEKHKIISKEILKEIKTRLSFLLDVGLNYLSLNRNSRSLSGGESQRIRLATQIGTQLVNVLYILDEPSIGLHQKDNKKLINSLKKLRDNGNSIIVVEHDKEMITSSDFIIDIGPGAGRHGGEIVASGKIKDILKKDTITTKYLKGLLNIPIPESRRKGNGKMIKLYGAKGNNLKNINIEFPLGKFICVTGVSGSGKSSLINETLHPILSKVFYNSFKEPLKYDHIEGISNINKVIEVNQSPIGKTPRSNPVTYTGVFADIRKLYEQLQESKIRGYKAGRFSFNVKGGRCESCKGAGLKTIEMNFLPDVYVLCSDCNGKRYNAETLEIKYKGKSIGDILNLTINQAVEFFNSIPSILHKLKILQEIGLGYIKLGQASTTLSGGEAQRIKLATELSKKDTGNTLYIFDEPTTGLHFEDIRVLLEVLYKLLDKGNSIIVIEHNIDVIKVADYIIDIGKEGGNKGGEIICTGTPEEISNNETSYTAQILKAELFGK